MLKKFILALSVSCSLIGIKGYANQSGEYSPCKGTTYFKMGGGIASASEWKKIQPAIGIGRRYEWNGQAVDVSANYSGKNHRQFFYSVPKIMYLQYLDPVADTSPYVGGGLSWGESRDKSKNRQFQGIFGELAAGIEFQRHSPIRTFVEVDVSEGLIASRKKNRTYAPVVMLTAGIGF
ncbi:MAG: hypothetical protein WB791_04270 [Waddliaceae bacterium]